MKTWICAIYGAGTPLYLISAKDEVEAWNLLLKELTLENLSTYDLKENCTGLIEVGGWTSEEERIIDLEEIYATKGILNKGWTM